VIRRIHHPSGAAPLGTPVRARFCNQQDKTILGKIGRLMADAGVNIEVIYSDHQNQLILVVDDIEKGRAVSEMWTRTS
jgi:hypothetical protein